MILWDRCVCVNHLIGYMCSCVSVWVWKSSGNHFLVSLRRAVVVKGKTALSGLNKTGQSLV